jgi:hypothetical protein
MASMSTNVTCSTRESRNTSRNTRPSPPPRMSARRGVKQEQHDGDVFVIDVLIHLQKLHVAIEKEAAPKNRNIGDNHLLQRRLGFEGHAFDAKDDVLAWINLVP